MRDHEGQDHYEPGELFVYTNGDRWELGMVKMPAEDGSGYFCWYSRGDTAARTPVSCMHKLANAGFTYVEKLLEAAENAKAENTELRKRMEWLEDELRKQGSAAGKFMAMAREYQEDNKKLREFAKSYLDAAGVDCGICPYRDPDLCDTETDPMREGCRLWEEMRELEVKVSE